MMYLRATYVLLFTGTFLAMPLAAQDSSGVVVLHAFGSWAYGRTSGNTYLAGVPDGDYRDVSFALNIAARLSDKVTIHAQPRVTEDEDGTHVLLSYAFAEYRHSDAFAIRFGQVKQPFGVFTEIRSVGTLRPFLDLPQGVYGPVGFAGDSYKGIGILGTLYAGRWAFDYDAYAGGTDLLKLSVAETFYHGGALDDATRETELQSMRDVLGGRLVAHTPVSGLSLGISAYTGILNEAASNHSTVIAGQLQFASNRWNIESEFSHLIQVGDERALGAYVQAAYRLTPEWQVALQGDYLDNTFHGVDVSAAPSLQHHREGAVALNYWISRELVIKSEFHLVNGNRFAMPPAEDLRAVIAAGALRTTTRLFQFGVQFTF